MNHLLFLSQATRESRLREGNKKAEKLNLGENLLIHKLITNNL